MLICPLHLKPPERLLLHGLRAFISSPSGSYALLLEIQELRTWCQALLNKWTVLLRKWSLFMPRQPQPPLLPFMKVKWNLKDRRHWLSGLILSNSHGLILPQEELLDLLWIAARLDPFPLLSYSLNSFDFFPPSGIYTVYLADSKTVNNLFQIIWCVCLLFLLFFKSCLGKFIHWAFVVLKLRRNQYFLNIETFENISLTL